MGEDGKGTAYSDEEKREWLEGLPLHSLIGFILSVEQSKRIPLIQLSRVRELTLSVLGRVRPQRPTPRSRHLAAKPGIRPYRRSYAQGSGSRGAQNQGRGGGERANRRERRSGDAVVECGGAGICEDGRIGAPQARCGLGFDFGAAVDAAVRIGAGPDGARPSPPSPSAAAATAAASTGAATLAVAGVSSAAPTSLPVILPAVVPAAPTPAAAAAAAATVRAAASPDAASDEPRSLSCLAAAPPQRPPSFPSPKLRPIARSPEPASAAAVVVRSPPSPVARAPVRLCRGRVQQRLLCGTEPAPVLPVQHAGVPPMGVVAA